MIPDPVKPSACASVAWMFARPSGSISGAAAVPQAGGFDARDCAVPPASGAGTSDFGPAIVLSGTTSRTSGSAASLAAWLAVIVAMTALTSWVEETSRPPAARSRATTGACWAWTAERRLAELAAMLVFWLRRIAMYFWLGPPAAIAPTGWALGVAAATLAAGKTIPAARLITAVAVSHGRMLREERRETGRGAMCTSACANRAPSQLEPTRQSWGGAAVRASMAPERGRDPLGRILDPVVVPMFVGGGASRQQTAKKPLPARNCVDGARDGGRSASLAARWLIRVSWRSWGRARPRRPWPRCIARCSIASVRTRSRPRSSTPPTASRRTPTT